MIKKFLGHELVSGAGIIFISSLIANIFNFLFNFFMSRYFLSPADYGVLASLISLLTLSTLPVGAALPTIVYFSASYFAKGDYALVRGLFIKITKPSILFGTLAFVIYILFRHEVASFLNIADTSMILLIAVMVYVGFISVANMPLLQAKLAFPFIAFSTTLSTFLKLVLGIILVMFGLSVWGALWAVFITTLIPYLLSFIPLRFLLTRGIHTPHIRLKSLLVYGAPATLTSFGLTSFINTDIILVKHFFDPQAAGLYATLSLVGRIIFFFSAPIGMVMFPLIVQKYHRNEDYQGIFRLALLLVLLPSIAITLFYFLFPQFTIQIFTQSEARNSVVPYIGLFAIFVTLYSLLNIVTQFYLAIKKTKISLFIIAGAIAQATGIWLYNGTLFQVIIISLAVISLLLILLLLYYWHLYGKKEG